MEQIIARTRRALASRTAYPEAHGVYPRVVSGLGPLLTDETGATYFDASGGSGSLIFGHGDTELAETLSRQAETLTVFPCRRLGVEIVEQYLQDLIGFAGPPFERALTFSSGSDAVEAALKLALHWQFAAGRTRKTKIIGRRGSYHGNTLAGLAAGGFVSRRKPYEAVLQTVGKAAVAHCPKCEFGLQPGACAMDCASSVEAAILRERPEEVAAVILEPIVGAALSAATPEDGYLKQVRAICDRYDVLLIFDEVMTGFGRTGEPFAWRIWDVPPDILVCGKGMSAGYFPLSGLLANDRVARAFGGSAGPFQNGHTHACSPLGAGVGRAVIRRLTDGSVLANSRRRGSELIERLKASRTGETIFNVRGKGLMVGFDIRSGPGDPPGVAADALLRAALRQGLIIYASSGGSGTEQGDHAMLLPPLTITSEQVEFMVRALEGAAAEPRSGGAPS